MLRSAALLLSLTLVAALASCDPGVAEAPIALQLKVAGPMGADNPFTDPQSRFIALTAEGPGITDGSHQIVLAYTPGMKINLGGLVNGKDQPIPYGDARQFRVELYPADVNGLPSYPIRAHGRTVPIAIRQGDAPASRTVYVTKVNHYAPAVNDSKVEAQVDPRAGAAVVSLPDHNVLIIGGAQPKTAATDAYDANSYANFQSGVLLYNSDQRGLFGPVAQLSKGRAFAAAASGVGGVVAIAGGYVDKAGTVEATNLVEYYDPKDTAIKPAGAGRATPKPHLSFARARHTITRLFDNDNYFLVAGGAGAPQAAESWEIWHPVHGTLTQGPLSKPRWNHCAVRVPDASGGYIMLVGGENASGTIGDFEVIRYDDKGNVAFKGNKTITCNVGGTFGKNEQCDSMKGQPGYSETTWEPIVRALDGGTPRTLASCTYQTHSIAPTGGGAAQTKFYVYTIGGFEDAGRKKALDRIGVYDLLAGSWVPHGLKLDIARGGAQIAVSSVGPRAGQVLISGGLGGDGKTVTTGEVVYLPSTGKLEHKKVVNLIPGGGRVLGGAVGLPTGHILLVGGVSSTDAGLKHHGGLSLWAPL